MLPDVIGGIVDSVVSESWTAAGPIAGGAAAAAAGAIHDYFAKRYKKARAIIEIEFAHAGSPDAFKDIEQFTAAAIRYERAVRDQAADENLRLLAQAMVGLAARDELWADKFIKYAEILAPLSRNELILLGQLMVFDKDFYSTPRPDKSEPALWGAFVRSVLPTYSSELELRSIAVRAQRSGLILATPGFDGGFFELTPLGREIRGYIDINVALGGDAS